MEANAVGTFIHHRTNMDEIKQEYAMIEIVVGQ